MHALTIIAPEALGALGTFLTVIADALGPTLAHTLVSAIPLTAAPTLTPFIAIALAVAGGEVRTLMLGP